MNRRDVLATGARLVLTEFPIPTLSFENGYGSEKLSCTLETQNGTSSGPR